MSRSPRLLGAIIVVVVLATGCEGADPSGAKPSEATSPTLSPAVLRTASPPDPPRFHSIAEALTYIRKRADVPVTLPKELPRGVVLSTKGPVYELEANSPPGWMLHLVYGTKKHLYIQFGSATFDGCGGDEAREVRISGMPARLLTIHHGSAWWSELIWPTTGSHLMGTYGLSGSLPPGRMLQMANSMPLVQPQAEASHNC